MIFILFLIIVFYSPDQKHVWWRPMLTMWSRGDKIKLNEGNKGYDKGYDKDYDKGYGFKVVNEDSAPNPGKNISSRVVESMESALKIILWIMTNFSK